MIICLVIREFVSNFALKMRSCTPDFTGKYGVTLPIFTIYEDYDTAII